MSDSKQRADWQHRCPSAGRTHYAQQALLDARRQTLRPGSLDDIIDSKAAQEFGGTNPRPTSQTRGGRI